MKSSVSEPGLNLFFKFQVLPLKPRMTSEEIPAYTSFPRSFLFLPWERKRRESLKELIPVRKWINSYMMSCSQMKNFIVCLIMLSIPCTENFRATCKTKTMEFITLSRLVMKHPPPPHTHTHTPQREGGGWKKRWSNKIVVDVVNFQQDPPKILRQEEVLDVFKEGIARNISRQLKCLPRYYS